MARRANPKPYLSVDGQLAEQGLLVVVRNSPDGSRFPDAAKVVLANRPRLDRGGSAR